MSGFKSTSHLTRKEKKAASAFPLFIRACSRQDISLDQIKELVKGNPKEFINYPDESSEPVLHGKTALAYACWYGDYERAEFLLGKGAHLSINLPDGSGATPLLLYLGYCDEVAIDTKMVNLLISHGAAESINLADESGRTPLKAIVQHPLIDIEIQIEIMRCLIENGAQIEFSDLCSLAIERNPNIGAVELLVEALLKTLGSEILQTQLNEKIPGTFSPLLAKACLNSAFALAEILIRYGASLDLSVTVISGGVPTQCKIRELTKHFFSVEEIEALEQCERWANRKDWLHGLVTDATKSLATEPSESSPSAESQDLKTLLLDKRLARAGGFLMTAPMAGCATMFLAKNLSCSDLSEFEPSP